jgi:dodecin
MERDRDDSAIVSAVIGLGRSLGMTLVAEGSRRRGRPRASRRRAVISRKAIFSPNRWRARAFRGSCRSRGSAKERRSAPLPKWKRLKVCTERPEPLSPAKRFRPTILPLTTEDDMAESVYKVIELIGTSAESWERAAKAAVERAAESLRDLRIAEVVEQDVQLNNGKVELYRTKLKVSFKYEGSKD